MARITPGLKLSHPSLLLLVWVLCSLCAVRSTAAADIPTIERVPAPAWVAPCPVDLTSPIPHGQGNSSIHSLLFDEQVHAGENIQYRHIATRILSESGVQEEGRVTLGFDPAYEVLALHKLVVHRDGKAFDRLPQQEIKVLQREQGLDRHLYDGRLSAVMLLEDIRVGDTIEYAYSTRGANPIFDGLFLDGFSLRWSVPLHKFRYRLLWPDNRKLSFQARGEKFEPAVADEGTLKVYTWERSDIPPVITDGDLPTWFDPYGMVQLSEFPTWRDVAQWANRLYVVSDNLPDDLRQQLEVISKQPEKKAQAVAALRFVQNNIRYLGMETGVHGYKPYPLETVWKRRFGDCKDKALVLCTLLRQLGLEAYPALVETDYRHTIAEWLPSPLAFDHLVVNLRLDGREYWLDPTMSHQGGSLDELYFPNYGKALVINDRTTALSDVTPGGFKATAIDVTSTYEAGPLHGEMRLTVQTVFSGIEADRTRSWLAEMSAAEVEKSYVNFYAKRYPGIRLRTSPRFVDDLEKNQLVAEESYTISNFWQPVRGDSEKLYGEFSPDILSGRIEEPRSPVRSMPLRLPHPLKVTETLRISFPRARQLTDKNVTVKDPAFSFWYTRTPAANTMNLHYQYETLASHIDAPRTAEYLAKVREMSEYLEYTITAPKGLIEGTSALGRVEDSPDAAAPSPATRGFMLAPFVVFAGIVVVWAVQRFRPAASIPHRGEPMHYCHRCGITEHSAPEMEFRVTSDGLEYCRPHLPGEVAHRTTVDSGSRGRGE